MTRDIMVHSIREALAEVDGFFADMRRRSLTDLLARDVDVDEIDNLLADADCRWAALRGAIAATLAREGLRP